MVRTYIILLRMGEIIRHAGPMRTRAKFEDAGLGPFFSNTKFILDFY
jgi:hypothetical protein